MMTVSAFDKARNEGRVVYFEEGSDTVRILPGYCLVVRRQGRWMPPSSKPWRTGREGDVTFPAPDTMVKNCARYDAAALAAVIEANATADGETLATALIPVVAGWL